VRLKNSPPGDTNFFHIASSRKNEKRETESPIMVEKTKNGNHAQRQPRELKNETYLRSNFQRRSLGSLFSVDDGVPARGEMVTVSFTERNFFLSGTKIYQLSFPRKKLERVSLLFALFFAPLFRKNLGGKLLLEEGSQSRKKKKIGHRRDVIGCEINRTHLAETANDCADKANIVCGIECNI